MKDYDSSEEILRKALTANPGSPQLVNNLAFTLASSGRIHEAQAELKKVDLGSSSGLQRITLTATHGLVLMRQGEFEPGRVLYRMAIELATKLGQPNYVAMARAYLAREEHLAGYRDDALKTLEDAKEAAGENPPPDVDEIMKNVRSEIVRSQSDVKAAANQRRRG